MSPAVGCMAVALLPKPLPLTISELSGAVAKRPGLLDVLLHHDLGGGFGLVLGTYQQNRLGAWAQGCGLWVSPFPRCSSWVASYPVPWQTPSLKLDWIKEAVKHGF